MKIEFPRADVLRNVQQRLIQTYGGLQGVRDENGLESAISRPKQLEHYNGESRVGVLAAALSWALMRNHPFTDGNKRVALAALTMFAELNECVIGCSEVEETAMVLRAAAGEITEEQWTEWVERVIVGR